MSMIEICERAPDAAAVLDAGAAPAHRRLRTDPAGAVGRAAAAVCGRRQ
jgi:hypothetical protein